jgi:aryl-alcohol dehydrogenase-like predicted oxidoreductase
MKTRRLGRSGLTVSEVGLGCNNFGMRIDQKGAQAVVDAALDAGVTFFDTADMYGGEQSETLLGQALGKRRRDVVVATKFGLQMGKNPLNNGRGRRWMMQAVEDSLRRLATDYIDLYQVHWPDPQTPVDETLRALDDLVTQGKVRYIGSSNFVAWEVADAEWTARASGRTRFISAQNKLSILEQGALAEMMPACEHYGVGFLPYFPLASGLLSGKYRKGEPPPADTRFAVLGTNFADGMDDAKLEVVERLAQWAEARGHSLIELAFAWLLGHPAVSSVIAGATKPEQAKTNAAAAGWTLTPDELAEVSRLAKAG